MTDSWGFSHYCDSPPKSVKHVFKLSSVKTLVAFGNFGTSVRQKTTI